MGLYKCVMVVTLLYTCIGIEQRCRIGTKIVRYRAGAGNGKIHPKCLLSGVYWLVWLVVHWFIGSDFCPSIKKFFIFPIFFHNYLISNALKI